MSKTYLYVRISKKELNHDNQLFELKQRYPDAIVFAETISGGAKRKPVLDALIAQLQAGDTLAIYALDRLSRRGGDGIRLLEDLLDRDIKVVSLKENWDFSDPSSEFVSGVMLLAAKMERKRISERISSCMKRVQSELNTHGNYTSKKGNVITQLGRPPEDHTATIQLLLNYRQQGNTIKQINKLTNISTGRICQLLKGA